MARADGSYRAVLDAALSAPSGRGVLVDGAGVLVGTVTANRVVAAMSRPAAAAGGIPETARGDHAGSVT